MLDRAGGGRHTDVRWLQARGRGEREIGRLATECGNANWGVSLSPKRKHAQTLPRARARAATTGRERDSTRTAAPRTRWSPLPVMSAATALRGAAQTEAPAPPQAQAKPHHATRPSPPPPPGGPATSGFFRMVDSIHAFLAAEAAVDGWVPAAGEGGGASGAAADTAGAPATATASEGRPPPYWDWVAGQLLPLLQTYSGAGRGGRRWLCAWQSWDGSVHAFFIFSPLHLVDLFFPRLNPHSPILTPASTPPQHKQPA